MEIGRSILLWLATSATVLANQEVETVRKEVRSMSKVRNQVNGIVKQPLIVDLGVPRSSRGVGTTQALVCMGLILSETAQSSQTGFALHPTSSFRAESV